MVPEIIAEVQITYSSKVKACDRFRVTGSKDAAKAFSKGGMTGTVVDVRVVFQVALKSCTTSIF